MVPQDASTVIEILDSADLVMAQRASPDFHIKELRPNNIREKFENKCIIWPNIYFDGYFPGLRYVYGSDSRKLTGPLGDYHFEQILGCWLQGIKPAATAEHLTSSDGWAWCQGDPALASLERLEQRETDCHVAISDHIARNFASRKLMYAMNHPHNSVLLEMLDRMLAYAGYERNYSIRAVHQKERLDRIDIPMLPRYFASQGIPSERDLFFDGFNEAYSTPQRYSPIELVEAFYRLYQDNKALLVPVDWPN